MSSLYLVGIVVKEGANIMTAEALNSGCYFYRLKSRIFHFAIASDPMIHRMLFKPLILFKCQFKVLYSDKRICFHEK